MADRIMFVQLKTGHDVDKGPAWISVVRFNRSWKTAYWHGKTLRRHPGMSDANFYDTGTGEEYWLSDLTATAATHATATSDRRSMRMLAEHTKYFSTERRSPAESALIRACRWARSVVPG